MGTGQGSLKLYIYALGRPDHSYHPFTNLQVTPGPNMVLTKLYMIVMTPHPWDPLDMG